MISNFKQIEELFKEIDMTMTNPSQVFVIGGAVLLYQGLKPATKDIDIVVDTKKEFFELEKALFFRDFKSKLPSIEYSGMDISHILIREDFRIDLFCKKVCKGFSLSKGMKQRANTILQLKKLSISLCSNEDIFLFKTLTEREGDLEDCISLAQRKLEWSDILKELKEQIKESKRPVWLTLVGERLDILEERGLVIPFMKELNEMREKYFEDFEKRHNS